VRGLKAWEPPARSSGVRCWWEWSEEEAVGARRGEVRRGALKQRV
jgi:hypothetical protein